MNLQALMLKRTGNIYTDKSEHWLGGEINDSKSMQENTLRVTKKSPFLLRGGNKGIQDCQT